MAIFDADMLIGFVRFLAIVFVVAGVINAIKAINEVGLFQYIEKPWDNSDLLIIIPNGLEKQKLMKKLREKIVEINSAYGELESLHKEIVKTFV